MSQRIVRAYHAIFTAYGFWLPNDPRGSWSDYVGSWELARFGPATKVTTRRSVAASPHSYQLRQHAKKALKYPPVSFTGVQARAIGCGIREAVEESGYVIHACSILPEHIHLVLLRHRERSAERIIGHLKTRATQRLRQENLHPLVEFADDEGNIPTPWTRKSWPVFLYTDDDIRRAIRYVERNPMKEDKPRQLWSFITPLDQ